MEFNRIIRGPTRAANNEACLYNIPDTGFLCQLAFVHEGKAIMLSTAYGRKNEYNNFHGSTTNTPFILK